MSAGIWVIHRAGKSGGEWWRFLTDTVMMVWVLVYGSYIELANLGLSWWCFLTDTVMLVWVLVYGSYKEVANLWVSGDTFWQLLSWWYECNELSLLNDCLWYDKLLGPSQRVVTLFLCQACLKLEERVKIPLQEWSGESSLWSKRGERIHCQHLENILVWLVLWEIVRIEKRISVKRGHCWL